MSEYYAVQRSGEYLEHYGVKGMKWGVRKAVEKGNSRKLTRQYNKAAKKLAKLNARANIQTQQTKAAKYGKFAKNSAGIAASGGLMMAGGTALGKHLTGLAKKTGVLHRLNNSRYSEYESNVLNTHQRRLLTGHDKLLKSGASKEARNRFADQSIKNFNSKVDSEYAKHLASNQKLKDQLDRQVKGANSGFSVAKTGSIMAGVGLLGAGIAGSKALAAKRRTTEKGHAKAVAKRDAWRKEMQNAFKGTKYAKLPEVKSKQRKYFTKDDFKQATKAAGLSVLMGPMASHYLSSRKAANEISESKPRHGNRKRKTK